MLLKLSGCPRHVTLDLSLKFIRAVVLQIQETPLIVVMVCVLRKKADPRLAQLRFFIIRASGQKGRREASATFLVVLLRLVLRILRITRPIAVNIKSTHPPLLVYDTLVTGMGRTREGGGGGRDQGEKLFFWLTRS